MTEAEALVQRLSLSQNPDGGWAYNAGSSWAEPTALSILALRTAQEPSASPSLRRAVWWLASQQKRSGGWPPNAHVAECTSVTSLCALALLSVSRESRVSNSLNLALEWTANQVYREELTFSSLLSRTFNLPPVHPPGSVAWYPGTAGWTTPTSLSAITLLRAAKETNKPDLRQIALRSCSYLLSRRCADQGWNHGGSKTRSEDAVSYPETTGLALLALRAAAVPLPASAVSLAIRFASSPESMEGLAWIQLALNELNHPIDDPPEKPKLRTTRDCALRLLSLCAKDGKNIFLERLA